ncbi:hypothetical protein BS333_07415 [Vibrio azureus]|uniref:Uncharacterized protein n=1 Tax=Vibrio azureus NBRC 104587 TaxID=1219077 RepID=U3CIL0_9VIBR|nr:hypothetical protein [Vibrio azureus]AUI86232.1 hypothetical protein BS333_07415 [Vibrio azureus]GAD78083.1 hypothetical protein VAZ01S_121_00020 [Vibrio azureus NBRC 104587]
MFKALTSAIMPSNVIPESVQKERALLRDSLDQQSHDNEGLPPFADSVRHVNNCLISHNHHGLPEWKSEQYRELTQKVTLGEVSNSYAFLSSSLGWATEVKNAQTTTQRAEALVGAVMNFGGALASGAVDHQKMKGLK